ncbi:ferrochelatase [Salinisphaera hydrothermalis]|uniref:Ferrochelatase n=1 Tax=Salinisphaera hydrothermalis (strain C41B8) TaxID=1304275 RepID=A0A084IKX9_SALHC|nr:ferrochelatase [Salinisphaera hydrothermalis]KEZ77363.1 ferrochelatase [Salinisphaera hydrothermalis C41B8]
MMRRNDPAPVGVLFTNLGSPDDTSVPAVRRYLREFLSDRRVIDLNRAAWLPILYGIILTFRPRKSAKGYRSVWMDEGSPLLVYARRQVAGIQARLDADLERPVHVALGMRYGNPSIESGLEALHAAGCRKILVLPAYPQYSATTVATTFDKVSEVLEDWPEPPALRQINRYHDDPGYIAALAASVREHWAEHGRADKLVISFHGIPKRYVKQGDPYPRDCGITAQLLAAELGLSRNEYKVCFQSRFGREPWLQPYLDETMKTWGADPEINTVDVICPGFSSDCLETLEEIREENRGYFEQAGGESLRYIPALNDRDDHIEMFARLIREELAGWV